MDNVFEVEKAIDVTELMSRYGYRLQLAKEKEERPFQFQCAYIRIGIQERSLKKRGRAFSARSVAIPLTALASSGKTEQMQPDHSGPIA